MRYIWLIPLLPGAGAAINGLVGIRAFSRRTSGVVACTMMGAALVLAVAAYWQLLGLPADARAYDVVVAVDSGDSAGQARWLRHVPGAVGLPPRSAVGDDADHRHRHR